MKNRISLKAPEFQVAIERGDKTELGIWCSVEIYKKFS